MQNHRIKLSESEKEYLTYQSENFYVGIDPGLSGAIAVLDDHANLVNLYEMPVMAKGKGHSTVKNQLNAAGLTELLFPYAKAIVIVELINAMPKQGVSSMFSLGDSCGAIRGVCSALKMQMHFVTPQTWKKHYKLPSDKEYARSKAIELYPDAHLHRKKDADKAEAILIARYGYHTI